MQQELFKEYEEKKMEFDELLADKHLNQMLHHFHSFTKTEEK